MLEKLRRLKEKSHMTNQQIAEKSNIPDSTVARIFSGKTPNPTISTVVSMARAMGGSAADLFNEEGEKTGNTPEFGETGENSELLSADSSEVLSENQSAAGSCQDENSPASSAEALPSCEKYYEEMLNIYKDELKKKDEWIAKLFWCLISIIMIIMFFLIFDILHPGLGFVKY